MIIRLAFMLQYFFLFFPEAILRFWFVHLIPVLVLTGTALYTHSWTPYIWIAPLAVLASAAVCTIVGIFSRP